MNHRKVETEHFLFFSPVYFVLRHARETVAQNLRSHSRRSPRQESRIDDAIYVRQQPFVQFKKFSGGRFTFDQLVIFDKAGNIAGCCQRNNLARAIDYRVVPQGNDLTIFDHIWLNSKSIEIQRGGLNIHLLASHGVEYVACAREPRDANVVDAQNIKRQSPKDTEPMSRTLTTEL